MEGLSSMLRRREELMNKKFDYIIVTSDNHWEASGTQETEEQLKASIEEVRERLDEEGRYDVEIVVYKSKELEVIEGL